ncbi:MAG: hypothetical protein K8R31_00135 [Bacteroidales bacterium]|nr:hypothetical protein [Bacteroidales bacterium]
MKDSNNLQAPNFKKLDAPQIEQIVDVLKQNDTKRKRVLKILFLVFSVAILVYFVSILIKDYPFTKISQVLIPNLVLVIMLIGLLLIYPVVLKLFQTDFSRPVLEMLKRAEKKYKFIDSQWIIFLIIILIVDLIISIIFKLFFNSLNWSTEKIVLISFSIFIPLLLTVIIWIWYSWKKYQLPLKNEIRRMINEIEDIN